MLERQPAVEQPCGVCKTPLATAVLDDGFKVRYCERCRGILLPRTHFAEVVQKRRWWATAPPAHPVPIEPRELERSIKCPGCATRMSTHPYTAPAMWNSTHAVNVSSSGSTFASSHRSRTRPGRIGGAEGDTCSESPSPSPDHPVATVWQHA